MELKEMGTLGVVAAVKRADHNRARRAEQRAQATLGDLYQQTEQILTTRRRMTRRQRVKADILAGRRRTFEYSGGYYWVLGKNRERKAIDLLRLTQKQDTRKEMPK